MTTLVLITHLLLSQAPADAKATVVQVLGRVELVEASGSRPLERFVEVPIGATIQTFSEARASLRLPSGTLVRLGPDTKVELAMLTRGEPAARRQESIKISVGRLWARVTRLFGDDSRFQVQTDNAVAGVRGTEFFVETTSGRDQFTVDHGIIVVDGAGGTLTLDGPGAVAVFQGGHLENGPKLGAGELSHLRHDVVGGAASLIGLLEPSHHVNHEPFRWVLVGPNDPVDDILPASRVTDSFGGSANVTVRLNVPNL